MCQSHQVGNWTTLYHEDRSNDNHLRLATSNTVWRSSAGWLPQSWALKPWVPWVYTDAFPWKWMGNKDAHLRIIGIASADVRIHSVLVGSVLPCLLFASADDAVLLLLPLPPPSSSPPGRRPSEPLSSRAPAALDLAVVFPGSVKVAYRFDSGVPMCCI